MPVKEVHIKDSDGEELHTLKTNGDVAKFGRDKRVCHVAFDPQAARVSRVHASIEWSEEEIVFTDKSKEGTTIDGTKLKQSSRVLDVGVYQVQIGGIPIVVEVEGDDLQETVVDSSSSQSTKFVDSVVEQSVPVAPVEECDDVSSLSTFGLSKEKTERKRKSDVSIFDEFEPRGKRGPTPRKQANFDEEMENRVKKGPKTRKATEPSIFEDETPAKKSKPNWEPVPSASQRLLDKKSRQTSIEAEDEITVVASRIAAIPSVSSEPERKIETQDQHFDRGPSAPNETIKYMNLVYHPQNFQRNDTTINSHVENYKKFKPRYMKDGRVSVASTTISSTTFHTTIPLIDAREIQ